MQNPNFFVSPNYNQTSVSAGELTGNYNAASSKRFYYSLGACAMVAVVTGSYNKIYKSWPEGLQHHSIHLYGGLPTPGSLSWFASGISYLGSHLSTNHYTFSAGVDNTICGIQKPGTYASPDGVYKWNGINWDFLGLSGANRPDRISVGNDSNIWVLKNNGEILKYSGSGTTWNTIGIYARAIAAASDGGLWLVDKNGDLWFRASNATLMKDTNGAGFDLIRLTAAGSSTSYKLAALDRNGNLYSAANNRTFELEGIGKIAEVSVAEDGYCAILFPSDLSTYPSEGPFGGAIYLGWIKNCIPGNWPY